MSQEDLSAPSSSPWSELDTEFRKEVVDKLSVARGGKPATKAHEQIVLKQCEDFLVEQFQAARLQVAQQHAEELDHWKSEYNWQRSHRIDADAEATALRGQLATAHEYWQKIDTLLGAGGINDPAFLYGMVQSQTELLATAHQEIERLTKWHAEHPSYYVQLCETLKIDPTKPKDLWQCINGLQERVKFTESFESIQLALSHLKGATTPK